MSSCRTNAGAVGWQGNRAGSVCFVCVQDLRDRHVRDIPSFASKTGASEGAPNITTGVSSLARKQIALRVVTPKSTKSLFCSSLNPARLSIYDGRTPSIAMDSAYSLTNPMRAFPSKEGSFLRLNLLDVGC